MTTPSANPFVLAPGSDPAVTRREFLNGTATLAGGVAAGTLIPVLGSSECHAQSATQKPAAATPASFDPRTGPLNYLSPVQNQDYPRPCNSCTAYAVVASVEATHNKSKSLPGSQGPDLDENDFFSAAGPPAGCDATHWWPKGALKYCETDGLKVQGTNQRIKIASAVSLLKANVNDTQAAMKDWIFLKGPVVAIMVQYDDFYEFGRSISTPNPNVYSPGKKPGQIIGGHAISIVGYSGNDHWICKNSWGKTWNGDGYVRIAQGRPGRFAESYLDQIDVWGVTVAP
jgi:C1A family cysteine protease